MTIQLGLEMRLFNYPEGHEDRCLSVRPTAQGASLNFLIQSEQQLKIQDQTDIKFTANAYIGEAGPGSFI